jgi:hypothetical protein
LKKFGKFVKIQKYIQKMQKNSEKFRKMQKNAEKCIKMQKKFIIKSCLVLLALAFYPYKVTKSRKLSEKFNK